MARFLAGLAFGSGYGMPEDIVLLQSRSNVEVTWMEQLTYGNATPSQPIVSATFPVDDYVCAGGEAAAFVVRPADNRRYPLLSFLHGLGSGGDRFMEWHEGVVSYLASLGYVVAATKKGVGSEDHDQFDVGQVPCVDAHLDHFRTLEWALASPDLQKHIDKSAGTGILGSSCGAYSTLAAASDEQALSLNVKMAIAGHPHKLMLMDLKDAVPKVPILVITGDADEKNKHVAYDWHESFKGPEQLLVEVKGSEHNDMSTQSTKHFDKPYYEHYLACKMKGDATSCAMTQGCDETVTGVDIVNCMYATN